MYWYVLSCRYTYSGVDVKRLDCYALVEGESVKCPYCHKEIGVYSEDFLVKLDLKSACHHAGPVVSLTPSGYPTVAVWFHSHAPEQEVL